MRPKRKPKSKTAKKIYRILKSLDEANEELDVCASDELLNSLSEVRYHADLAYRQSAYLEETFDDEQPRVLGVRRVLH